MTQHAPWLYHIFTLGPIGYLYAPGTLATLVTIPFAYYLQMLTDHQMVYMLAVLVIFCCAIITMRAFIIGPHEDPSEIVIDELVGCLITFCGIPFTPTTIMSGFLLFRFFDITKVAGVRHLEHIGGAWGIMLDDAYAGLLSNIIMRIIVMYAIN